MKYPKTRYTGEHPWTNKDWLYNEYITEDRLKMFYYIINYPNFQDDNNVITYCIECHKDAHRAII